MILVNPEDNNKKIDFSPIDAKAFLAAGWITYEDFLQRQSEQPEEAKPAFRYTATLASATQPMEGSREQELREMDGRKLKAVARKVGVQKEEDQSYFDLIPQIVEAEKENG